MLMLLWLACRPPEPVTLARPNALAVGADGTVYVSDFGHDRLVELDAEGDVVRRYGGRGLGPGELWRVFALAVDLDGSLLVSNLRPDDVTGAGNIWEIKRFSDGREIRTIPFAGHFSSSSDTISSMAVRADGSLLMANPAGGELFLLGQDGSYEGAFGGVLQADAAPSAIEWTDPVAWVLEQRHHRILQVGSSGAQVLPLSYGPPGGLSFPSSLAVCPGEWFAVADLGNHRVQRFGLDGTFLDAFTPERAGPDQPVQLLAIEVSADCERLYLADSKGDRVLITTPTGEVLREVHRVR